MDLSKLLHGFVKVEAWFCWSCSSYFSLFAKQNQAEVWPRFQSLLFELNVLIESKYSKCWVRVVPLAMFHIGHQRSHILNCSEKSTWEQRQKINKLEIDISRRRECLGNTSCMRRSFVIRLWKGLQRRKCHCIVKTNWFINAKHYWLKNNLNRLSVALIKWHDFADF